MDRIRVRLDEGDTEERAALRGAFATGSTVSFRGGRVSVWGEFVHGANGKPASYEYEVKFEEGPGEAEREPVEGEPAAGSREAAPQRTVTLDDRDVDAVELLQGAFFSDRPVTFRGELVRVRRQFKHQEGPQWLCTFELEEAAA